MRISRGFPLFMVAAICTALTGCVSSYSSLHTSQLSPLQVRAIQSRAYEDYDAKTSLKTVLNVLQDEGFMVDYGNVEMGLLHATQTSGGQNTPFFNSFVNASMTLAATVNVSESPNGAKVRINFQLTIIDSWGQIRNAVSVTDPKPYQEFFAKLDRALFIQKQGL